MQKEDLRDWTREQLEIALVYADDFVNNYSNTMAENAKLQKENYELKAENKKLNRELDKYINRLLPRATKQAGEEIQKGCWDLVTIVTNGERGEMKALIDENKALKQKIRYIETMLETSYKSESAESIMRKVGFSEEAINSARESVELLEKELKAENTALKQHIKDIEDVCDGSCFF